MKTPKFKIYFIDTESFDYKIGETNISYATSIEHPFSRYISVVMVVSDKEYIVNRVQSLIVRAEESETQKFRQQMTMDFYGSDLVDLVKLTKAEYEEKFHKG